MNDKIIEEVKQDIVERFGGTDGFLTDDLFERYDFDEDYAYGDAEEFIAIWLAELLAFELLMEKIEADFDFDEAYADGMHYIKGMIEDWG